MTTDTTSRWYTSASHLPMMSVLQSANNDQQLMSTWAQDVSRVSSRRIKCLVVVDAPQDIVPSSVTLRALPQHSLANEKDASACCARVDVDRAQNVNGEIRSDHIQQTARSRSCTTECSRDSLDTRSEVKSHDSIPVLDRRCGDEASHGTSQTDQVDRIFPYLGRWPKPHPSPPQPYHDSCTASEQEKPSRNPPR